MPADSVFAAHPGHLRVDQHSQRTNRRRDVSSMCVEHAEVDVRQRSDRI